MRTSWRVLFSACPRWSEPVTLAGGRLLADRLCHQAAREPRPHGGRRHDAPERGRVVGREGAEEPVGDRTQVAVPRVQHLAPGERERARGGQAIVLLLLGLADAAWLPSRISRLVAP